MSICKEQQQHAVGFDGAESSHDKPARAAAAAPARSAATGACAVASIALVLVLALAACMAWVVYVLVDRQVITPAAMEWL